MVKQSAKIPIFLLGVVRSCFSYYPSRNILKKLYLVRSSSSIYETQDTPAHTPHAELEMILFILSDTAQELIQWIFILVLSLPFMKIVYRT